MRRRGFLLGLGAALAAPAIVRAEVLMPVRSIIMQPVYTIAGSAESIILISTPSIGEEWMRNIYLMGQLQHETARLVFVPAEMLQ